MKYRIWTDYTGAWRKGEYDRQDAVKRALEYANTYPYEYLHSVRVVEVDTDVEVLRTIPKTR